MHHGRYVRRVEVDIWRKGCGKVARKKEKSEEKVLGKVETNVEQGSKGKRDKRRERVRKDGE